MFENAFEMMWKFNVVDVQITLDEVLSSIIDVVLYIGALQLAFVYNWSTKPILLK